MNLYTVKRTLMRPYVWFMRFKERNRADELKSMLEWCDYSPAFYRLHEAFTQNPDILIEAPGLGPDSVVFDVGAFDGDWAARVFEKFQATICTFEVEPDFCTHLERRFGENAKIRRFDFGLGGANGDLTLTRAVMGSSLFPREGDDHGLGQISVRVRDIVEVMDEIGAPIDLMKINIEGGEYDLLERLIAADRVRDVRCFMIQYHEWLDGAYRRRKAIQRAMSKTHDLVWDYPFVWELWVRKGN